MNFKFPDKPVAPIVSTEDMQTNIVETNSGPPVITPTDRKRKIYDNNEIIINGGNDIMDVDDEIFDGKRLSVKSIFGICLFSTVFSHCRRFEANEGQWSRKRIAIDDKRIEKSKSSTPKNPGL